MGDDAVDESQYVVDGEQCHAVPPAIRRRTADVVDCLDHGGRLPGVDRRHCAELGHGVDENFAPLADRALLDRQRPEAAQAGDELGEPADARQVVAAEVVEGGDTAEAQPGLWCRHRRPEQQ